MYIFIYAWLDSAVLVKNRVEDAIVYLKQVREQDPVRIGSFFGKKHHISHYINLLFRDGVRSWCKSMTFVV